MENSKEYQVKKMNTWIFVSYSTYLKYKRNQKQTRSRNVNCPHWTENY
jgi:hypothetical protein